MLRVLPPAAFLLISTARAGGQDAGAFDYYLLALSWSPSWCETTGGARDAEECEPGAGLGFILHGLWPQLEEGWPEWCRTTARDPTRVEMAAMADVMGSGGLAWYQWQKHGRCSGLEPEDYFALARQAVAAVKPPGPPGDGRTTAATLEQEFLALNPEIGADGLVVTCREGLVAEIRICVEQDLEPRTCAPDVLERECRADRQLEQPPPR